MHRTARRGDRRRRPGRGGCSRRPSPSRPSASRTAGATSASARSTSPSRASSASPSGTNPQAVLAQRCRAAVGTRYAGASATRERHAVHARLDDELAVIADLGYPTYFLSVAAVVDLIRDRGIRVAARGSGAGSLVNYLLGISGVDPIRYDLLMERFCSPLRAELPDIDIDVESARRTEIYEAIIERFGAERVTCVSMMDTYKVRHAVRDVGAALGMTPPEIDEIATAFPHIRARDARSAIADLPELRSRGLDSPRLARFFDLVEALDGLPGTSPSTRAGSSCPTRPCSTGPPSSRAASASR